MKRGNKLRRFEVHAKGGHGKGGKSGRKVFREMTLAILAYSGKEAAAIARQMPRVKHDQKDAIISVDEIVNDRFEEIIRINKEDPYYKCRNIQDQRKLCQDLEIFWEPWAEELDSQERCWHKHRMNRKKYWTRYVYHEDSHAA